METVGVWLRQAREAKGSTLEEAADATRIRPRFLEALETGDFTIFSVGEVQIRGFLRIYARYLGLSPEEILARHDAEGRGGEAASSSEESAKAPPASSSRPTTASTRPQPRSITAPTARPRQINLEKLMVAGLVLIILLAIVAGIGYFVSQNNGGARRSAILPATATSPPKTALAPEAADEPVSATPTLSASSVSSEGGVTLTLNATEHVWTRVKSDNRTVFEGMMTSGQTETWSGQEMIVVETGNGAGLQVSVNGQPQGTMCARAQVCTRAWGPMGEIDTP